MPVKFIEGAHWYSCRDGKNEPKHDADLRVARKESLYPSPTTIDKAEFVNVALDRWKTKELLEAASSNFRQPHESIDEYEQRLYEISLEKSKTAADFGKEIHDAIEHYPQIPLDPKLAPFIEHFAHWFDSTGWKTYHTEKILVDHDIGVAGRCDRILARESGFLIPDFKTQGIKPSKTGKKRPLFYESWPRQLAFYAVAYAKESGIFPNIPECMSVVIDSTEASPPYVKMWTKEEILRSYDQFVTAAWRWFDSRDYWPQPNGKFGPPKYSIPMPI